MEKENTSEQEGFRALIQSLELKSVLLVGSDFHIVVPPEAISPKNVNISIEYSFEYSANASADVKDAKDIFCFVNTAVTGKFHENLKEFEQVKDRQAFLGAATFAVRYLSNTSKEFSADDYSRLTKVQATFQAYPYVRSYFDMQFRQMGLSGVVLPLIKSPPA